MHVTLGILTLSALAKTPDADITRALDDFTQGAAERDVTRVERSLHPEARQFVFMPDGLQVLDRPTYVSLLKAEKIGGVPTERSTVAVQIDGLRATATQVRDMGEMALHDTLTLVREGDDWRIVSVAAEVVKP